MMGFFGLAPKQKRKRNMAKANKGHGRKHTVHCVKKGKTEVACFRTKRNAKKRANSLRKKGAKNVRVVPAKRPGK